MTGGRALLRDPDAPVDRLYVDRSDGASIAVCSYGPAGADAVVLVHGFAVNAKYWFPQINGLAGDHRVIVYDQRGHGRSTLGTGPTTNEHLGQDLEAVLAATLAEGERAVIVGHSMGGMTVMSWATQYPDSAARYAAAIMLAGTAATAPVSKAPIRLAQPATIVRRVEYETAWLGFNAIHRPGGDLMMRTGLPLARTIFPGISRQQLKMLDSILRETGWRTREKLGRALEDLDVGAGLRNMPVPVAVVVGDRDRLTPPRLAEPVAAGLRAAGSLERYEIWRGATHLLNWEQPYRFNNIVRSLRTARLPH
ncbi:alpha/beta hydrolase [Williamsia sp. 1138]|uniref:alpha/beta fold hydrolase n=1 Tax=Williamsia sp. 1138 TaxID=1903117 RepID=UPI000A10F44D|nr:alpha/beta hydrolase [Williamsia sp. 1138]OZG30171.1 alpha/beta hydrolase [Williamsia sp. 1138]